MSGLGRGGMAGLVPLDLPLVLQLNQPSFFISFCVFLVACLDVFASPVDCLERPVSEVCNVGH